MKRLAALVALAVSLNGTIVLAQQAAPAAPQPGAGAASMPASGLAACRQDLQSLCAAVGAGGGARVQCLVQNRDKVSPACADVLAAIEARGPRAQRKAERQAQRANRPGIACRADAQALCGSAERGAARQQCLRQHEPQLSPACRQALGDVMTARREARVACRADRLALCKGEAGQPNAGLSCLQEQQARVSPQCSAALARLPTPRTRGAQGQLPVPQPNQQPAPGTAPPPR